MALLSIAKARVPAAAMAFPVATQLVAATPLRHAIQLQANVAPLIPYAILLGDVTKTPGNITLSATTPVVIRPLVT